MLLIYYNILHQHFYLVYTRFPSFKYYVGYTNQFGHILVQMFYIRGKELYNINSYHDISKFSYKESLKNKLITRLVRWLNKLKG